jgi:hypothetical protein
MARKPALTKEEEVARLLGTLANIRRAADAEMRLLEARAAEFNRQMGEIEQRLATIETAAAAEGVTTR